MAAATYQNEKTSPDGGITVQLCMTAMRMSHWIGNPRVLVAGRDAPLLDLWHPDTWDWDASVSFPSSGVVELALRKYPGDQPTIRVAIDTRSETYRMVEGELPPELTSFFEATLSSR
ncbi:MAG TPA: hypothetical protein QGF58_03520 [Myxococcota bacterium]|nr:hypothetical protein [Myxococcota bacterium]